MTELIVTITHVRQSGMCVRGARLWFESQGLDFRAFLTHGMPISQAEALDDAFARRVVAFVKGEHHE